MSSPEGLPQFELPNGEYLAPTSASQEVRASESDLDRSGQSFRLAPRESWFNQIRDSIHQRREQQATRTAEAREAQSNAKANHEQRLEGIQRHQAELQKELDRQQNPDARQAIQEEIDRVTKELQQESAAFARNIVDRLTAGEQVTEKELMIMAQDAATNAERSALAEVFLKQQGFKTFQEAMTKLNVKSTRAEDLVVRLEKNQRDPRIKEHLQKLGISTGTSMAALLAVSLLGGPISWAGLGLGVAGGAMGRLGGEWYRHRQLSKDGLGEKVIGDLLGTIYLMQTEAKNALEAAGTDESQRIAALSKLLSATAGTEIVRLKEYKTLEKKATKLKAGLGLLGAVSGSLIGSFLASGAETAQMLAEAKAHGTRIYHDVATNTPHLTQDPGLGHQVYLTNKGVWRFMLEQKDIKVASDSHWLSWLHGLTSSGQEVAAPAQIGGDFLLHAGKAAVEDQGASLTAAIGKATLLKTMEVWAAMSGAALLTEGGAVVGKGLSEKRLRESNRPLIDMLEAEAIRLRRRTHPDADSFRDAASQQPRSVSVDGVLPIGTVLSVDGQSVRVTNLTELADGSYQAAVEPVAPGERASSIEPEQDDSLLGQMRAQVRAEQTNKKFGEGPIGPEEAEAAAALYREFQEEFTTLSDQQRQATGLTFEHATSVGVNFLTISDTEDGQRFFIEQTDEGNRIFSQKPNEEPKQITQLDPLINLFRVVDRRIEEVIFAPEPAEEQRRIEPTIDPKTEGQALLNQSVNFFEKWKELPDDARRSTHLEFYGRKERGVGEGYVNSIILTAENNHQRRLIFIESAEKAGSRGVKNVRIIERSRSEDGNWSDWKDEARGVTREMVEEFLAEVDRRITESVAAETPADQDPGEALNQIEKNLPELSPVQMFEKLYFSLSHFPASKLEAAGIKLEDAGRHYVDSIVYSNEDGSKYILSLPRSSKQEPDPLGMKLTHLPTGWEEGDAGKEVQLNPSKAEVEKFFNHIVSLPGWENESPIKEFKHTPATEVEASTTSKEVVVHPNQSGAIDERPEKPERTKRGHYLPERTREREPLFKVNDRVRGLINATHEKQRQRHIPDDRSINRSGAPDPDHSTDLEAQITKLQASSKEEKATGAKGGNGHLTVENKSPNTSRLPEVGDQVSFTTEPNKRAGQYIREVLELSDDQTLQGMKFEVLDAGDKDDSNPVINLMYTPDNGQPKDVPLPYDMFRRLVE